MAKDNAHQQHIHELVVKLGLVVKKLREERSLSRVELAFLAKLHPSYIGTLERGEINPSFYALVKIARVLEVKLSDLIKEYEK